MKYLKTYEQLYPKDYFTKNIPKHIEHADEWNNAVNIATKNGTKSNTFAAVTAIYNNLDNKIPPHDKENHQYNYYKKKFDLVSWGNNTSHKKFILSLLNQLKTKHKLSDKQWAHLKRKLK